MITLILTFKQAKYFLEHIPEGHHVGITAGDLNRILDYKPTKKYNEDYSGGTQSINTQQPNQPQPQQSNNTGLQPQNSGGNAEIGL